MNVHGISAQQAQYMHKQSGGNGSHGAMREIMQRLPQEDREALKEQIQSLDSSQKKEFMNRLSKLDFTDTDPNEILSSVSDILNSFETSSSQSSLLDQYA